MQGYITFPHAKQVFRIHRKTINIKSGKVTEDDAYGVTDLSAEQASPKDLLAYVRGHWHVENKLHYMRDVTYGEDKNQIRSGNGPRVMATLRNCAIGLLRRINAWTFVPQANRRCVWDPQFTVALLGV